jgi:hypothetical protein
MRTANPLIISGIFLRYYADFQHVSSTRTLDRARAQDEFS